MEFSVPTLPADGVREVCGVTDRSREILGCRNGRFIGDRRSAEGETLMIG